MDYEETIRVKAAEERAKLSDGWRFHWAEELDYRPGAGPRHWARWTHPSGFMVGETDAGTYMATERGNGGVKDASGQYMEWSSPEAAIEHINSLRRNSL